MQLTITICIICKLKSQGLLGRGTQRRFPSKYVENTFQAIQSSFRSQEIHSKRRYKLIGFCSVTQGTLRLFEITRASELFYTKILDAIYPFTNHEKIFLIPLSITFFESESFRFRFSTKNSITWRVKCDKFSFRKSRGFMRKLYMNGTVMEKFLAVLK